MVKIQVSSSSAQEIPSYVIGSFQGQAPPNLESGKFTITSNNGSGANRSHLSVLSSEDDHVVIKGTLNTRSSRKNHLTRYAVGILDGDSIKLAESYVVDFAMVPKSLLKRKANEDDDEISLDEDNSDDGSEVEKKKQKQQRLTGMAARNLLGETFGSKKKKQEIKALERNKINVTDLQGSADFIANSINEKSVNIPSPQDLEQEKMEDSIVPPFDLLATKHEDMYPMSRFMTLAERNSIYFGNLLKLGDEEKRKLINDKNTFPAFVASRLSETLMKDIIDEEKLRDLLYLAYLIQFRECKESDLNKPSLLATQISHIPRAIVESFFSKFTETFTSTAGGKSRYKLPARLRDKILCYILVLAFRINGFSLCLNELVADLKISMDKLVNCCRFVGAKSSASAKKTSEQLEDGSVVAGKRVYKLDIPLTFPKPRQGKKKA